MKRPANIIETILFTSVLLLQSAMTNAVQAEDWNQFLGPKGESAALNAKPPTEWDATNYTWDTDLPGTGWSSPVIAGNRIWMTYALITKDATEDELAEKRKGVQYPDMKTAVGTLELHAICVDAATGKIVEDKKLATINGPELINPLNSYASPTPAISDGKIVFHFGNYGTWCFDIESGKQLWQKAFVVDHSVGPGSSPIVYKDKVVLVCDGIDEQYVTSVDLNTGDEVWKTKRPTMRAKSGEQRKAYSTAIVADVNGSPQVIVPGAQWIVAYDAESGKEIWKADHGDGFSVTPMASLEDGVVIFSTGFMRPEFVAVDPTGTGDVTKSHLKWRAKQAPSMPSFVSHNGMLFSVTDKGILNCINTKTGEVIKRKRVGGNFSATPFLADGNLYLPSREGVVTVVKCDATLDNIASNKLDSRIMASPAPLGNDLIIRTEKKLYRISNKKS